MSRPTSSLSAVAGGGGEVIVCEKSDKIGGSTGMSGGMIWIPDNPLMRRERVPDSRADGLAYFESVVGDAGPASSAARRENYLDAGSERDGGVPGGRRAAVPALPRLQRLLLRGPRGGRGQRPRAVVRAAAVRR